MILFGEGNSSAKCVGPSRAISVVMLLYSPRNMANELEEYLFGVSVELIRW